MYLKATSALLLLSIAGISNAEEHSRRDDSQLGNAITDATEESLEPVTGSVADAVSGPIKSVPGSITNEIDDTLKPVPAAISDVINKNGPLVSIQGHLVHLGAAQNSHRITIPDSNKSAGDDNNGDDGLDGDAVATEAEDSSLGSLQNDDDYDDGEGESNKGLGSALRKIGTKIKNVFKKPSQSPQNSLPDYSAVPPAPPNYPTGETRPVPVPNGGSPVNTHPTPWDLQRRSAGDTTLSDLQASDQGAGDDESEKFLFSALRAVGSKIAKFFRKPAVAATGTALTFGAAGASFIPSSQPPPPQQAKRSTLEHPLLPRFCITGPNSLRMVGLPHLGKHIEIKDLTDQEMSGFKAEHKRSVGPLGLCRGTVPTYPMRFRA